MHACFCLPLAAGVFSFLVATTFFPVLVPFPTFFPSLYNDFPWAKAEWWLNEAHEVWECFNTQAWLRLISRALFFYWCSYLRDQLP